ncbi:MAG TPA: hypoxanthine-guanine phosphoribosyltransferase [Pseudomonadales bacterium]|nr:hypoxanthine-guanine phosphoribosyltransferase [Pseudomonadales bacterium]
MTVSLQEVETVWREADCLFDREQVHNAIDAMAEKITAEMKDANPLLLSLMSGAMVIAGKLLPRLDFHLQLDYIHATRYRNNTQGVTEVEWLVKPRHELQGRTVLIIDDILDEGITLHEVIRFCEREGARKIYTAVLVEKHHDRRQPPELKADFVGLDVPDRYVFGYGMDYKGYLRNAPGIYAVKGL